MEVSDGIFREPREPLALDHQPYISGLNLRRHTWMNLLENTTFSRHPLNTDVYDWYMVKTMWAVLPLTLLKLFIADISALYIIRGTPQTLHRSEFILTYSREFCSIPQDLQELDNT